MRLAQAELVELGGGALAAQALGLVDGEQTGRPERRSCSAIVRSCGVSPARPSTRKITTSASAIACRVCLRHLVQDAVLRHRLEAAGVDHEERASPTRAAPVMAIAREAREVGDERVARARQAIEQRRLADVGPADEDESGQHRRSRVGARPASPRRDGQRPAERLADRLRRPTAAGCAVGGAAVGRERGRRGAVVAISTCT